jgi:hypothetical protein
VVWVESTLGPPTANEPFLRGMRCGGDGGFAGSLTSETDTGRRGGEGDLDCVAIGAAAGEAFTCVSANAAGKTGTRCSGDGTGAIECSSMGFGCI